MSTVIDIRESLGGARLNAFRDRPGINGLDDPIERAAVLQHRMGFDTPSGAAGMLASSTGRVDLVFTWSRLDEHDRQLYRRRAAVLAEALIDEAIG